MPTVTVPRTDVSQEDLVAALRDRLDSAHRVEAHGSDTVRVRRNVFSHVKVHLQPSGSGTAFKITPYAVGPLGYAITSLGLSKRVASAITSALG